MEQKCRAAVYARVSTAAQDPEPQLGQLRRFVLAADWELYREYFDTASGSETSRPQLSKLMDDAFHRRFDVVVVWKFDRFGRSVSHLIRSLEEFQSLNIGFVSVSEKLDTSSPIGKAVFTFLGALAEFERSMIRERVMIGQAHARARGIHLGRIAKVLDEEKIKGDYLALRSLRKTAALHRCSQATIFKIVQGQREVKGVAR
jgi:DNA invertase Pin-like site-specific DNA recombinase